MASEEEAVAQAMAQAVQSATSSEQRVDAVRALLQRYARSGDADALDAAVAKLVNADNDGASSEAGALSQHVARQALAALPGVMRDDFPKSSPDTSVETIGAKLLERLAPHVASGFEDTDAALRRVLFDRLVAEGAFTEAARTLAGINFEAVHRGRSAYSEADKAATYVEIAETFLEDDESVDAEAFVNRASGLMHAVSPDNWALHLRYRVTLARTLDARRKFLEAATSYYELSQAQREVHAAQIATDDLLALLAKAVTCALLGNAGPQRSRLLATLHKDERVEAQMAASAEYAAHATVLSKMCAGELVAKKDVAAFEATLLPHQKALASDGLTIPERATIQHNLAALTYVYDNVSFDEAATLLDIDASKAMRVAARMIADHRLAATIDQVDGVLVFGSGGRRRDDGVEDAPVDDDLAHVCHSINLVYDKIDDLFDRVNNVDGGGPAATTAP